MKAGMGTEEEKQQLGAGPAAAAGDKSKEAGGDQEPKGGGGGGGGPRAGRHTCWGCRFPLLVAILQLLLGVAVAALAFIMNSISPSLLARETPHWAGIIACLVALLGFVLYCVTYLSDEKTSLQFVAKLLYFLLCTLALVLSLLALAFAGHHYDQVSCFTCSQEGDDCRCVLEPEDPIARPFLYADAGDCSSITDTLKLYFVLQMALNLAQALVCLAAAFVMWKHRYQVFFAGLQVDTPSVGQWQKV